jgi:acetyl-CoA carboxylase alpha subunit
MEENWIFEKENYMRFNFDLSSTDLKIEKLIDHIIKELDPGKQTEKQTRFHLKLVLLNLLKANFYDKKRATTYIRSKSYKLPKRYVKKEVKRAMLIRVIDQLAELQTT